MAEPFYWNLQPCNKTHINELKLYLLMREQTLKIRLKNHFLVRNPGKKKTFEGEGETKNRSIQQ